jgi:hypothetical protein
VRTPPARLERQGHSACLDERSFAISAHILDQKQREPIEQASRVIDDMNRKGDINFKPDQFLSKSTKRNLTSDRSIPMTDEAKSPLRRHMIEDITIRRFAPKTQHDYVQRIKNFAVFLGRSPDTGCSLEARIEIFSLHRNHHASKAFGRLPLGVHQLLGNDASVSA